LRSCYEPLPVSAIVCTLVRAKSFIDKAPVRVPVCVGEKLTLTVQFFPVVSLAGQSLVCVKSPLMVMLVILCAFGKVA